MVSTIVLQFLFFGNLITLCCYKGIFVAAFVLIDTHTLVSDECKKMRPHVEASIAALQR